MPERASIMLVLFLSLFFWCFFCQRRRRRAAAAADCEKGQSLRQPLFLDNGTRHSVSMYGPRCPVVFMAWIREVQNAKEVVNKELSSLADMFRKYNRDEDKDKDDKGRGGKKKKTQKAKKHWCFWECVLFLEPRGSFYDSCSTTVQVLTLARFGGWNCFLRFSHGRKLRRHEAQVPTCSNRIVFQVSIQLPIEKHRKTIEKDAFPVVGFLVDDFCWSCYWSRSYL